MIPISQAHSLPIRHVGIGVFDGVHQGHQEIIRTVLRQTSTPEESAILTFHPHPLEIISPDKAPFRLTPPHRMEYWIHHYGIPHLIAIKFDDTLRHLSPNEFVLWLKRHLPHLKSLTVGFNWRFGFNGLGSVLTLVDLGSQLDFATHIVPPISIGSEPASSTRIREAIQQKNFSLAEDLLGHPFEVCGKVIPGDGKGKKIGFPTANLELDSQILPPFGVYACQVAAGEKTFTAVVNHGIRPTFSKSKPQLEAHLLHFKGDLYDKEIILSQWHWIRDEIKFSTEADLKKQINTDIKNASQIQFS